MLLCGVLHHQLLQRHCALVHHIAAFVELPAFLPELLFTVAAVVVEALQVFVVVEMTGLL